MKILGITRLRLLLAVVFLSAVSNSFAQESKRLRDSGMVNIDTVRLAGLTAGEPVRDIAVKAHSPIDTVLWGGEAGASILQCKGKYLGMSGDYRFATRGSTIHQITFSFAAHDSTEAVKWFSSLQQSLESRYGSPTDEYANAFRFVRWKGQKQILSLQTKDGTSYVSLVLSEVEKPVR